jgi:hypothetical protein
MALLIATIHPLPSVRSPSPFWHHHVLSGKMVPNSKAAPGGTIKNLFAPCREMLIPASDRKLHPRSKGKKPIIRTQYIPEYRRYNIGAGPDSEPKWAIPSPFASSPSKVKVHVKGFAGGLAQPTGGNMVNSEDQYMVDADGEVVMSEAPPPGSFPPNTCFEVDANGQMVMSP